MNLHKTLSVAVQIKNNFLVMDNAHVLLVTDADDDISIK